MRAQIVVWCRRDGYVNRLAGESFDLHSPFRVFAGETYPIHIGCR